MRQLTRRQVVVGMIAGAIIGVLFDRPTRVTPANIERIQIGMNKLQVTEILGEPTSSKQYWQTGGCRTEIAEWRTFVGGVRIIFRTESGLPGLRCADDERPEPSREEIARDRIVLRIEHLTVVTASARSARVSRLSPDPAGGGLDSRARRFLCLSRHEATPRDFLFELNADGTDYTPLCAREDDGFDEQWTVLRMVLEDAPQKLTRQDILDEWPADFAKPAAPTLWTWLRRAAAANLILAEGSGRKTDPFRYWLPATEERWKQSPLYDLFEEQRRQLKLPFESLRECKRRDA